MTPPGADLNTLFEEGVGLTEGGRALQAVLRFQQALLLAPGHPDILAALADAQRQIPAPAQALATLQRVLEQVPAHPFALLTRARALADAGDGGEADPAYAAFLDLNPGDSRAWLELGSLRSDQGRFPEALEALDRALALAPGASEILMAKGYALYRLMRLPEAIEAYDGALASLPPGASPKDRDLLRWNRCLARLLLGRLDPEAWEARELRMSLGNGRRRAFSQPEWDGSPLAGRTLLLHASHEGYGDAIMGLHYVPLLAGQGGRIVLEVRPGLADLARTCPGVDEVVTQGDPLPPFQVTAHLMSLPRILSTTLASIPATAPYLSVPPRVANREALDRRIDAAGPLPRIGLVHAGLTCQNALDRLDPANLAPLAALEGQARFFSLQKRTEPPLEPLPAGLHATDLGDLLGDFSDTAHALSRMDLLVTVDTSAAHLAGAMGVPAFVLLPFCPDWRWLAIGEASPWYPSLQLYRQGPDRDWAAVVARMAAEFLAPRDAPADA